jgi:hypothetical protein
MKTVKIVLAVVGSVLMLSLAAFGGAALALACIPDAWR